jgi:hypothetical protein
METVQPIVKGSPLLPNVAPVRKTAEPLDLSSGRYLNESAIRDHALRCSARFKCNRFTRVGQDFMDEVSADVEALVRNLRNQCPTTLHEALEPDENTGCVTGLLSAKVTAELNRLICRMIQNKVWKQPSCGKTLGRTR